MLRMKRAVVGLLCLMLIIGAMPATVLAKTSRTAVITEIVGVVEVTKSGGSKSYRAYTGMTLNQGDLLETGAGAKAVLQLADTEDEITIGQNARLYISELMEQENGKKSKLKVWAGALWSKVKTLAGEADEFEVETPTATMGVRGTHFFVGVQPDTGYPVFFTGSGLVAVKPVLSDDETLTLPGESTSFFEDESATAAVDLSEVFVLADLHTLEAMVQSSEEINEENRQLLLQDIAGSVQRSIDELQGLAQYMDNVSQYVGLIVSLMSGETELDELPPPPEPEFDNEFAEKEQQRREELKRIQQRKEEQAEAQEARRKQMQEQNQQFWNSLGERRRQQEQENQTLKEQNRQQVLDRYLSNLTEEERAEFQERENQRKEEERQSEQKAEAYKEAAPPPIPQQSDAGDDPGDDPGDSTGDSGSGGGGGGGDGGSGGGGDGDGGGTTPEPTNPGIDLIVESITLQEINEDLDAALFLFYLVTELRNVSGLYAAEIHFLTTDSGFIPTSSPLQGPIFNFIDSENSYRVLPVDVDGVTGHEIIYAATQVPPADAVDVTQDVLVTIPMLWEVFEWSNPDISHSIELEMIKAVLVDVNGDPIKDLGTASSVNIELDSFKNAAEAE